MAIQGTLPLRVDPSTVFTPNAPIDVRALFRGRKSQVQSVLRAVHQKGQHAILFGERGVGKTSLANVIHSFLHDPSAATISPRVNCDSMDTFESVWRKAFDEVQMESTIRQAGFAAEPRPVAYPASDFLGDIVSPNSVRRALSILARDTTTILIIDEFDRLNRETKRGIADTIKTLSDHAVPATVVLVGVADSVDELIEEHESIERALVQVHMPRMSLEEISEIIIGGLAKLDLVTTDRIKRKICTLAQGLPHYAHLIGLEAAQIAIDGNTAEVEDSILEEAMYIALRGSQASIQRSWHKATTSPRKDNLFSNVLIACALAKTDELGYFAPQDVRVPLSIILDRKMEIANYSQHLADFCDEKRGPVMQRTGLERRYRFRFKNPLMQPFVVMQGFSCGKISYELLEQLTPEPSTELLPPF